MTVQPCFEAPPSLPPSHVLSLNILLTGPPHPPSHSQPSGSVTCSISALFRSIFAPVRTTTPSQSLPALRISHLQHFGLVSKRMYSCQDPNTLPVTTASCSCSCQDPNTLPVTTASRSCSCQDPNTLPS